MEVNFAIWTSSACHWHAHCILPTNSMQKPYHCQMLDEYMQSMENDKDFLSKHPQHVVATVSNLSGFVQRLARANLRSALRRRVKMRPFLTLANCKCRSVTHLYLLRHSVARLLARSAIGSPAHSFVKLCAWWLIHDIIEASGWIFDSNSHSVAQLFKYNESPRCSHAGLEAIGITIVSRS